MQRQAVYDELFNMVTLYYKLCETDKSFGSLIFGLGKMSEKKLKEKSKNSVDTVAVIVPQRLSMVEEFKFFSDTATDAYEERYGKQ